MKTRTPPTLNVPCAGCKRLRRKCTADCIFVPYFPATEPEKFAEVHRVFGASNVTKMLRDIPVSQRGDAVSSLVFEARTRLKDPVYGCVSTMAALQHQVNQLQAELLAARAENASLGAQLSEVMLLLSTVTPRASTSAQSLEAGNSVDVAITSAFDRCYSPGPIVS
ncbi:LOB domain-containing protein 4-like [Nymphaea colorata]|nr:LOB domain-containing protein 4-like [Nymphaea colorata]